MHFETGSNWWKALRRMYRDSSRLSLLIFLLVIILLLYLLIKAGVDKEVIAISITAMTGFLGYIITHYLETERKKRDAKFSLYTELMSGIRVFTSTYQDKADAAEEFSRIYYTSYLYISTAVYKMLKDYMRQYKTWVSDKSVTNKKALDEKLTILMQTMRDEIKIDAKVDFVSFDIKAEK